MKNLNKSFSLVNNGQKNKKFDARILQNIPNKDLEIKELQNAIGHLQCLAKELEIYSDSLNHLPDYNNPLGNFILNSLQDIENKLYTTYSNFNDLNSTNQLRQDALVQLMHENGYLNKKIKEIKQLFDKKCESLTNELNSKKKEIAAVKLLAKSLKREKRKQSVKNYLFDYQLMRK